jgi:hypothetical protein
MKTALWGGVARADSGASNRGAGVAAGPLARVHIQPHETDTVSHRRRSLSFDAVTSPRHTKRGSVDTLSYTGGDDTAPYRLERRAPDLR